MKIGAWIALVAVVFAATVCGRLGLWQLERLDEKRAANAAAEAALALPPLPVSEPWPEPGAVRGRRVAVAGRFDERVQLLLRGRNHEGDPGVEVVTPLVIDGERSAVLVNRGWLPADDGATARPQEHPEPGTLTVIGLAEPIGRGGGPAPRLLDAGPPALYSVHALDLDSTAARLAYRLAPFVVRQLPGPGVSDRPLRTEPRPSDTMVHVGYATQWFLFAAGFLGAGAFILHRRWRAAHG